ncbi:MAG TPA: purine-nucleoside phosphorylase [Thermoanaerobaculales bacterium]|nr:purine-nucleoside phosphorylase [Thermoanaerobaculales bacterium]HPA81840.1 purine-nucleoside phosphorylase [Thermoanaerobaculales bacterium]HQL30425.1 purine-nucleoside phosphorylase [Thermoanaerobaculales bacterium]
MATELTPHGLREIADGFRERHRPGEVRALMVAGSGIRLDLPGWQAGEEIALADVFPFQLHGLIGHRQTMTLWRRGTQTILAMNGRLHLYQGYSPAEVVAPVRLAGLLGAGLMLATNASGALDPAIPPGSLVVVSDHLNLQGANPLVGDWGRSFGPPFPDMSEAYDPGLRRLAVEAAAEAGFAVREGVYAAVLGPSFETPAEVRMLGRMGGAVVGMSTVPEVIAARQMGMKVLVLSLATNPGAGLIDRPLSHEEVLEAGAAAAQRLRVLLGLLVQRLFDA